jgi:hypothetical protein
VVSFKKQPLYSRDPLCRMLGGPQELVWTLWKREQSFASTGNRTPGVQILTRRYTDRTTPHLPNIYGNISNIRTSRRVGMNAFGPPAEFGLDGLEYRLFSQTDVIIN